MKYLIITILFCAQTILFFAQETSVFQTEIRGSGQANGGTYTYKAVLKSKLFNSGLGDLDIKVGIFDYQILSFTYKGKEGTSLGDVSFPIKIDKIQSKFEGSFLLNANQVHTSTYTLSGVRKGGLDNITLNANDRNTIVNKYGLKESSNNLNKVTRIDIKNGKLINTYFSELSPIASRLKRSISADEKQTDIKQETTSSETYSVKEINKNTSNYVNEKSTSEVNSANQQKSSYNRQKSEENKRRNEEEQARLRREEEERLKQERISDYNRRIASQNERNMALASATAASSMGTLFILGGFIYSDLGSPARNLF